MLCMALCRITEGDPDFPADFLSILGGFYSRCLGTSGKEHLAYFADTSLNSWRGMVIAAAGVADGDRRHKTSSWSRQPT